MSPSKKIKTFPQYVQLCGGAGVLARVKLGKAAEHGGVGSSVQAKNEGVQVPEMALLTLTELF